MSSSPLHRLAHAKCRFILSVAIAAGNATNSPDSTPIRRRNHALLGELTQYFPLLRLSRSVRLRLMATGKPFASNAFQRWLLVILLRFYEKAKTTGKITRCSAAKRQRTLERDATRF